MSKAFSGFSSWLRSFRSPLDQAHVEEEESIGELPSDAFPLLPPGELLLRCRAKVSRIEELAGTTPPHFEHYYLETLHRFARYTQQRPASQASHSRPGGMLDLGLDTAAAALKIRQAYLLPPGAVPEEAVLKRDIWTFAVFTLALLHDLRQPAMEQAVTLFDGTATSAWNPWAGAMGDVPGVVGYRVALQQKRNPRLPPPSASLLLVNLVVAPAGLAWLASDVEVFSAWLACMAGDKMSVGVLGDILGKALRSLSSTLLAKPNELERSLPIETGQAEALPSPRDRHEDMPLHERMLAVLRDLVDCGELPLNAMGAKGWRKGDDVWLESPAIVDALRAKLLQEGHGDTLSSNQNAIDVLHRQGVLVPCDGKAVWNVAVHDGNAERTVAALRIAACRIWQDLALAPMEFAGAVEPVRNLPEGGQKKEAPAAKFVEWLRTGIAEGRIPCNERNARVHVVPEGVLLVTPNLFKDFVGECGGGRWETVQQLFVKRRDHVRTSNGENIHQYVVEASQAALPGFLLKDASLIFEGDIPPPNPFVVRRNEGDRPQG
jgi:hypothetical protein